MWLYGTRVGKTMTVMLGACDTWDFHRVSRKQKSGGRRGLSTDGCKSEISSISLTLSLSLFLSLSLSHALLHYGTLQNPIAWGGTLHHSDSIKICVPTGVDIHCEKGTFTLSRVPNLISSFTLWHSLLLLCRSPLSCLTNVIPDMHISIRSLTSYSIILRYKNYSLQGYL